MHPSLSKTFYRRVGGGGCGKLFIAFCVVVVLFGYMKKIIEYKVVVAGSDEKQNINEEVNLYIKNGWQPIGGVCSVGWGAVQAVVKYE